MHKFISSPGFSWSEIIRNKLVVLFLLALMVRLMLFMAVAPWKEEVSKTRLGSQDSFEYESLALGLINHHQFVRNSTPNLPEIRRTPGYPIFLAIIYKTFGYRRYVAVLFQVVLGALCCVLLYKTGELLFRPSVGLLAAYLLAFDYLSIILTQFILTETLFVFTFLLFFYLFCLWISNNNRKWLVMAAVTLGVGTLVRPVSLYLPLFLGVFLVLGWLVRGQTLKKRIVDSIILLIISLLAVSPWLIRNQLLFGAPVVTTLQGHNLLNYNAAYMKEAVTGDNLHVVRNQYKKKLEQEVGWQNLSEVEQANRRQELALSQISKYPLQYLKLHLTGMLPLLLDHGKNLICFLFGMEGGWIGARHHLKSIPVFLEKQVWSSLQSIWQHPNLFIQLVVLLGILYSGGIYLTAVWGIVVLVRQKEIPSLCLVLAVIVYFILISSPASSARFRIPIMPLLFLLSSVSIVTWHENGSGKTVDS